MRLACLLLLCLGLFLHCGNSLHAVPVTPVLVTDAAASRAFLANVQATGRCYAVDTRKGTEGTLVIGNTVEALPAGRYRLHVPLALGPLGELLNSAITITLSAGEEKRTLGMLHFAGADEFTDFTLDFTTAGDIHVPCAVTWAITGEQAQKNRLLAIELPDDPGDPDEEHLPDDEDWGPDTAADGTISVTDLPGIPYHLAVRGMHIEPLSPLAITTISTDKLVYHPGETGTATLTITNYGAKSEKAPLTVELLTGLTTTREIAAAILEIPAGESKSWTGTFATKDLYWGADLRATVRSMDGFSAMTAATFAVSSNYWETAIVSGVGFTDTFAEPANAEAFAQRMKENYFTVLEGVFWAPDDFGDFTPDTEIFFGGQTQYRGSANGTKNLLAACHQRGIGTSVYANLWGGGGAPTFDMMRKHPDWFAGASYGSDWLEDWVPMAELKMPPLHDVWPHTVLNGQRSTTALTLHAQELIASHTLFGWDGVRYDSFYSDDWTTIALQQVRAIVEKAVPNYRWGYNTRIPHDVDSHALDGMLHGGGLAMEEGIRAIVKGNGGSLASYLNTVVTYRDLVWAHGGHFGVCYDRAPRNGVLLDEVYLSSFLLAAGCHPYYSPLENQLGHYPRFALRYAEYLFNNAMRPLQTPEAVIALGGNPALLEWQRLARTVSLGGERHRLVLHLINPPADDKSLHNYALKTPPPLHDLPVTVKLPAGANVAGVWSLYPIPAPHHDKLPAHLNDATLTFTVPEVRFWNCIVIDFTAAESVP